jgi:hypothetical protein
MCLPSRCPATGLHITIYIIQHMTIEYNTSVISRHANGDSIDKNITTMSVIVNHRLAVMMIMVRTFQKVTNELVYPWICGLATRAFRYVSARVARH